MRPLRWLVRLLLGGILIGLVAVVGGLSWLGSEVDDRLKIIMKGIHKTCLDAAEAYATPGNYLNGANIVGFVKVVDAMLLPPGLH